MNALAVKDINEIEYKEFSVNLLNDFFRFLDVSEKTRATYQRALKQVFKFFADNGVKTPNHEDLINFKFTLEKSGRKASTIALYLAASRRFFAWCEQRGIYKNIAIGVKSPRLEKGHKRDFLGVTQIKKILSGFNLATLKGKRDFAIFSLMAGCGLRTIEVIRANVEDLRTLGDCTVLYVQGKGRKDRTEFVKISAHVLAAINDYLSQRGNVKENEPLFTSISNHNHNGRLTTYSISRLAKSAMRSNGFNSAKLTAHSLRHSAVTLALLGGQTLAEVQAFARHSNIATTQIYSHAVNRLNSMCENVISDMIFN